MADKKEATHSLRTEIEMLFKSEGALDLVGDIEDISDRVYNLTEPVRQLTDAFKELNASPVKDLVRTLENFSLDSVAVDASDLRKVLENKIARAITKSKIEFIGDEGSERYPFKVKLGADFWKKNQKNITEALAESFTNLEVDVSDIPPLDSREILAEFQKKFNEQIVELIKDEEVFSLYTKDPGVDKKKFKYKRKFKLDEKAVDQIISAIEEEFIKVLSDPDNIVLENIPKLNIKSSELNKAVQKIQESIGDIDSLLGVEVEALDDLPNIEDKLIGFRDNLSEIIKEINILAEQLESLSMGKITEDDFQQAIESINNLKGNVLVKLDEWVKDIVLIVDYNLDLRPSLDSFKESINNLNNYFDSVFQQQIQLLQSDIEKVLGNIKSEEDKKDTLKGKKIDITQLIIDVISENLMDSDFIVDIDMGLIDDVLGQWILDFNIALSEDLKTLTDSISKDIADVFEQIFVELDNTRNNIEQSISEIFGTAQPLIDAGDLEDVLMVLEREIYNYIIDTLTNVTLQNIGTLDIEFKLPKSFQRDIKQIVDKSIREYSRKIVDSYKSEEFGGEGIEETVEKLNKHATMLVNAVMREVNQTLTDIRKEFLHSDDRWAESTKNLKKVFDRNVESLTKSYIKVLEDSINTIILTEESLSQVHDQIADQIAESIKVSKIEVDETETTVKLDKIYRLILSQITSEIAESINYWNPNIEINESIDGSKISQRLTEMINEMLEYKIENWVNNIKYDDSGLDAVGGREKLNITKLLDDIMTGIEGALQRQINSLIQETNSLDNGVLSVNVTDIMNRIDSLIKEAVLNRVEKISLEQIDSEGFKLDLNKPVKKALNKIKKVINEVTNYAIASVEDLEIEEVELNIRTKRLQNNINNLIQKIVNEKAKQITAYGNQLVSEIDVDSEHLVELKNSIGDIVDNMIGGYIIAAESVSSSMYSEEELSKIYTKLSNGFADSFSIMVDDFLNAVKLVGVGDFSISTSKLHPKIRRALAESHDMSVREFVKEFPEIKGDDAQRVLMQKNVEMITKAIDDVIQLSVKQMLSSYEDSIKQVVIEPDESLVEYIYDRLIALQDTVITRAKKMVKDQFKYLTEEIKQMNIEAKSMGYKPTKAFINEVSKATGGARASTKQSDLMTKDILKGMDIKIEHASMSGADVVADGLKIDSSSVEIPEINDLVTKASSVVVDGKVVDLNIDRFPVEKIVTPIENLLTSELPFDADTPHLVNYLDDITKSYFSPSNVFKRGYERFDVEDIFLRNVVEPYEGLFEGVTKNMAKYFAVGYMMRLPIKAITEANKIASELDYHLAKARQNIIIKDPQMTTTAQRIVYDRYKAEGLDVSSKEFREDVNKEAANLRNIMNNQMSEYLLNISKAYYQEIADVGRYYSIASRRSRDPYEALTKTREIAKIAAVEEDLDTDFAATGLEALAAQWGVDIAELDKYTNMLLKTAMLSNTTVTDLLMAQRDTAAMFKSRLKGLEDEEAFATAMALSSMFVQATGKSGREAGTFWRNILQKPYVKDSRKFLEQASQLKGFENLSPYYVDETGQKVQKDFLTMFSNILETVVKVDDPSAMSVLSEIFPIRTIGGAESVSALVEDLKLDLERSIEILKDMGELDEDVTVDTANIKEVIEKYIENIMEVTEEDIGMYLAGLQDTTQFAAKGLQAQWQSTVYSIFRELKEETSSAMTYFTAILRKFEENSDKLSEVIGIFMKLGISYLGKDVINRIVQKGMEAPTKLTDMQKEMANKYMELQAKEKALSIRRETLKSPLVEYSIRMTEVDKDITRLQEERHQLHSFIQDMTTRGTLTDEDRIELRKAEMQRDMYDDQLIKLRNTYNQLEKNVDRLTTEYKDVINAHREVVQLGEFLQGSMGARSVEELKDSFANYLRNTEIYSKVAPLALRSTLEYDDQWYEQLHRRKAEIENMLISQQKEMFKYFTDTKGEKSYEILENILGDEFENKFYTLGEVLSEETIDVLSKINKHMEFDKEYAKMRKNFDKTYKELNAINSELIDLNNEKLEVERAIFEATRPNLIGSRTMGGDHEIQTVARPVNEVVASYRDLLPAFGIDLDKFEGGLDQLASLFKEGKFDVDEYEDSLREVSQQLGIADRDFGRFKEIIRDLNNEINLGKKSLYEYIAALEAAGTKGQKFKIGASLKKTDGGEGEVEGTEPKSDATGKGLLGLGALSVLGKGAGKAGKSGGKMKAFGKGLTLGIKGIVSKIPHMLLMYAGVSTLGSILGGLTERSMTEAERLSMEADKLEKHINKAVGWKIEADDSGIKQLGKKIVNVTGAVWGGAINQLNRWMGGTAPSFKETWDIRREAWKYPDLTKDELRIQLEEKYDVLLKRAEANYKRQQGYLSKNPFLDPTTGRLRDIGDPYFQTMPLEDLMEFLDKRMKELNKALAESDALFTKEKVRILIGGLSNNSKEMRDAVKNHLDRNIAEMTRLVNEFKEYLPRLVPGTEAHTGMQLQILDLENRIAEAELQKFETDFSEFDEIMERYSRQSTLIQTKYDIKKYDAILSGIQKDSSAIKQIEKKMAEEQVRAISSIQNKLDGLKQQYADKPDQREKILIQIQQLEADKKRILADIKDRMSEGLSTFNLPSDIKPITYYEAMTRSNTHKNMTVRAGDAIVNVNIDKMSGSDADLERLSKAVSSAVAQAQKNFVRQFANDVKSGMGSNYYSWNNY